MTENLGYSARNFRRSGKFGRRELNPTLCKPSGPSEEYWRESVESFFYAKVYNGAATEIANWDQEYDETSLANDPDMIWYDVSYNGITARGNPTTKRVWLNTTGAFLASHYTYDIAGNVTSASDANRHATSFSYSDNYSDGENRNTYGLVTSSTNALGQTNTMQNDYGTGQPVLAVDANGARTAYAYSDPLDRLTQMTLPTGATLFYSYPSATEVDAYEDQNNPGDHAMHTQTLYDGFGRQVTSNSYESASQYIATTQSYDALGRAASTTNPSRPGDGLGYATTYSYDGLGRQTKVQTADGAVAATSYSGNQTTATDQAEHARTSTLDGVGNLSSVREDPTGLNYTMTYSYDALGDLTGVSQSGRGRSFTYDSLQRLAQAANPESGTVSYTYDSVGNLLTRTDARNIVTSYGYDALNRLLSKKYSDGTSNVTYSWDPATANGIGRLGAVANGVAVANYTGYDAGGNLTQSNQQTPSWYYNFSYAYNLASALTSETYPSGRVVATAYDGANRANAVTGKLNGTQTNYAANASYWPHGALEGVLYGNNVAPIVTYDSRLQPGCLWDSIGNNPNAYLLTECNFNWGTTNNNGNLLSATVQAGGPGPLSALPTFNASFAYDNLNRLTSVSDSGGWSRSFGYDPYGNMWVTGNSGVTLAGNTPASNVFTANNQIAGTSYDAAGNQLSANGDTITYDAENRQISATEPPNLGGATESYLYDGVGQRVEKSGPNGATVYVYDAFGELSAEYSSAPVHSPCTTCYLSYDHLGSARLVTDQNANVIARHDYLPFGEEIAANTAGRNGQWGSTTDVEQKFTGQFRDTETGIDFFNARYFGAALGRFTSPDPYNIGADPTDPQTWNAYAYVRNNPLNAVDPTGMDPIGVGGGCTWDSDTNTLNCPSASIPGCVAEGTEGCIPPPVTIGGPGPGGSPGTAGGGGGTTASSALPPPKNGTKQTFSACMAAHANDFSIAGALNHTYNAITGSNNLAFQNNFFAQAVLGNPITTLAYGSATDNAGTAASLAPAITQTGMGAVTSYGRRTTTIMALNLAGEGGVPLALGAASAGTKAAIGRVANVAGGFMSLEVSLAVNVGFTAAEAAYCASQP